MSSIYKIGENSMIICCMLWILVLFFRKYLLKVLGDVAVLVTPSTGYFTNKRNVGFYLARQR